VKGERRLRSTLAEFAVTVGSKLPGQRLAKTLRELQRAQWLSPEELQIRNQISLQSLLKHAAGNVPFYRNLYQRFGLASEELSSVTDLSALPVLNKSHYRNDSESFYAANVPSYRRLERTTSGSTGEPFSFCLDRRALSIIFASHLFYDSWHGLRPVDRYIRIVTPPAAVPSPATGTPPAELLRQAITNRIQHFYESWTQRKFPLWEVDADSARTIWRQIESFRPKFVMGYTSALAAIADQLLQQDLRLSCPLRGVITIAETLSPPRRRLIEQYFAAPIINRYGLREFGSWSAQSCAQSPEHFHVNTELVVCEILRADGSHCAPGETGRVVLTDLHNYARPFIRYNTGDLAVAGEGTCSCGRGFPMLGQIEGRSRECLRTPSGKEISPVVLGHYLFVYHDHLEFVRHYQLVQESESSVRLLIVPSERWQEERREKLRADLVQLIENEMHVSVELVSDIQVEKSGKRPIIKILP
jgi:phenylacetate-CoA ligase